MHIYIYIYILCIYIYIYIYNVGEMLDALTKEWQIMQLETLIFILAKHESRINHSTVEIDKLVILNKGYYNNRNKRKTSESLFAN